MKSMLIGAVAIVAVSVVSGCASSTERAESKAVSSVRSFREELVEMPDHVDRTMNKLYAATDTMTSNRADSYNEFRDELRWLQQDANRVAKEAEDAKRDRENFFREWNREAMKADPAKRETMKSVAAARDVNYNTAISYLESAKQNYRDLVAQLNDIDKTLGADLNRYSTPAVKSGVGNATAKANNLKNYISRLTEQVDSAVAGVNE